MRIALTIFWIIIGFLVLGIFSLNIDQLVDINLFFAKYEKVNLLTVTFSSLFVGFVLGIIFFLIQIAKAKKVEFQLKKQIRFLQDEINKLNSKAVQPSAQQSTQIDESRSDINDENS